MSAEQLNAVAWIIVGSGFAAFLVAGGIALLVNALNGRL